MDQQGHQLGGHLKAGHQKGGQVEEESVEVVAEEDDHCGTNAKEQVEEESEGTGQGAVLRVGNPKITK